MEFSNGLFFFMSLSSTDVDLDPMWLCLLAAFIVVVVGALQLSAGELIGLVEAVLVGDPPVSLLLLLSHAAGGNP